MPTPFRNLFKNSESSNSLAATTLGIPLNGAPGAKEHKTKNGESTGDEPESAGANPQDETSKQLEHERYKQGLWTGFALKDTNIFGQDDSDKRHRDVRVSPVTGVVYRPDSDVQNRSESKFSDMFKVSNARYPKGTVGNAEIKAAEKKADGLKADLDAANAARLASMALGMPSQPGSAAGQAKAFQEHSNASGDYVQKLRDVAARNNGYLPTSKHPTKKEIEIARFELPDDKQDYKNGEVYSVKLGKGVSRGKKVHFKHAKVRTSNEWGNPLGKTKGIWIDPVSVENPKFKP